MTDTMQLLVSALCPARHSYLAEWSRVKGLIILLVSSIAMSLVAEVLTDNIQPVLQDFGVTESFVGVLLLALAPDIPEIVNGIQFALQNNIALSIEVGSSIAVQVCLLQIPVLVFVELIYPVGFVLRFNNICLWSVLLSTLLMNYTYMDGKSDYFQGSALCIVYMIAVAMFYFIPSTSGHC
jgi:calcium/proton exchanger cax